MEKRYIFFDLDGTLTDSYPGIRNSLEYALRQMNINTDGVPYSEFVGPPLSESFVKILGLSQEMAEQAIHFFYEYYPVKGIFENSLYPGVMDMLKVLNAHGKKLMVASAKPENFVRRVLDHFDITDQFCFIAGVNYEGTMPPADPMIRKDKADVIGYVLRENGILEPEKTVMVGDRASDMHAAKLFGLQTIGTVYGYGTESELKNAGADMIVSTPMEVADMIVQTD